MFCWKCKKKIEPIEKKIGFRAVCDCGADLHVCKNCKYYSEGKPNDCLYPDTLFVSDRMANNFCEEFSPLLELKVEKTTLASDLSKKLFGEDLPKKKDFSSLFDKPK